MDLQKLKDFIELAKESGVEKLEYEKGGEKISVTLPGQNRVSSSVSAIAPAVAPTPVQIAPAAKAGQHGLHEVKSPFVGTFYASPSPNEPHYVKVGDHVRKGQVLCILEAMKIMNEIESDISGEVVQICVENEGLVEFNQALFLIKVN